MAKARKLKAVDEEYAAQLDAIQEFAESLPERFLHCRELGHNWKPWKAAGHADGGFERTLRCTRCRTLRVEQLTNRGGKLSSQYKHPDGYLQEAGAGRIVGEGRDVLRLTSLKRLMASVDD